MSELPKSNLEGGTRRKMDAIAEKHQRQPDKFRNLAKELETDSAPDRFHAQLKRTAKPPPEKGDQ
ncbi:hypothetical protein [uncultured Pelagibacterium sp.]|uniref:hypothetical protein n=1 Tax=uncultured Pelagibacterium sp. TaxID=1159875 RepID=UPI0030DACEE9|tara:strand:- start:10490 stop:10684 length:195 start_codon:yes stop_codon:yes gene_type:complete